MSILNAQGSLAPQASIVPVTPAPVNSLGIPMSLMVKANTSTQDALGNFVDQRNLDNAVELIAKDNPNLVKSRSKDKNTGEVITSFAHGFEGQDDLDDYKSAMADLAKVTAKGMTETECLAISQEITNRNIANGYRLGVCPSARRDGVIVPKWIKVGKVTAKASAAQQAMEAMGCTYDPKLGAYKRQDGSVIES